MNRRSASVRVVLVVVLLCCFIGGCAAPESFTVIVLPDTQNYADTRIGYAAQRWGNGDLRETFYGQTEWIRDNAERLNIVMVAHVGDIVQTDHASEWEIASAALSRLDGEVPYILCLGNHDMGHAPGPGATGRSAVSRETRFNDYFGAARLEACPWYGGRYGKGNDNSYALFEAGGLRFVIVSIEFKPRDEVLAWAGDVLRRYPDRRGIVLTHSYLRGNERIAQDNYNVTGNSGQAIWEKFISRHENVSFVLCGHTNVGYLRSPGRHGNDVHQILSNYQSWQDGGEGNLRIMTFVPSENRVGIKTFSTVRDEYVTTEGNAFSLDYPMARSRRR